MQGTRIPTRRSWEELIAYFPLIWHGPHRKRNNYGDAHRQQGDVIIYTWYLIIFRYRGNIYTELFPSKDGEIHFPLYDTGHIENTVSNNFSAVACVFVTAETFLPSRCLATMGGIFIESLPSNDGEIHFPWYDMGRIENDASNNSSAVACAFVTTVTFLPSRCLATVRRFLPNRAVA
jgi:hypothetical protein